MKRFALIFVQVVLTLQFLLTSQAFAAESAFTWEAALRDGFHADLPTVCAADFGFSPAATPDANAQALQKALDGGRKIVKITEPGEYLLDRTVYLDDFTVLSCEPGVILKKAAGYVHVLVNRGVLTRSWNQNIFLENVQISVNEKSVCSPVGSPTFGLRGHVSFFRAKNVGIRNFKCLDVFGGQFCVQFCSFENFLMEDFEIRGMKDGMHVGAGKNFIIRNGLCQTFDDAIALNAQDYATSQPTQGTIENGLVENVTDLNLDPTSGNAVRLLTGAWVDWHEGIMLQNGDTVRHGKNIYRVHAKLDTTQYRSSVPPTHSEGSWVSPDGINFVHNSNDGLDRAEILNVTIRNFKSLSRNGFAAWWEDGKWHRAVHPEVKPENLPRCEIYVENFVSETPKNRNLLSGNTNLKATFKNVRSNGAILSVGASANPLVMDCSFEGCVFLADDKPETIPDVRVTGNASGTIRFSDCREERPIRLNVPESVTIEK